MGLQVNGTGQTQPMNGISFGQPTINYYVNPPKSEPDSYMGKTVGTVAKVGTIAGLLGAILFHRNIAGFMKNHKFTKGIYEWFGKHLGKHIREHFAKNSERFYVKWARSCKKHVGNWGDSIVNWFKGNPQKPEIKLLGWNGKT